MSAIARAILPSELVPCLRSLLQRIQVARFGSSLPQTHTKQHPECIKIGICVSGGPDSMALAYLLRNVPSVEDIKLDPLAFIVDHKAREGSTDEALKVQGYLDKIGIPARILTMIWPEGVKPLSLSNFESQARYLRYRLIARSALREGIKDLFVGHHQDDQVETVLMRLIRQAEPSLLGLRGISWESPIPCCDDMYGAHEQGIIPRDNSSLRLAGNESLSNSPSLLSSPVDLSAPGGILLHRPLLAFPKLDLIATCQKHDVPFVIDLTNKDPRSNTRNAVRYMRGNHSLPEALSSRRILDLQSRAQYRQYQTELSGAEQLEKFQIRCLDLRTGAIEVTLPALVNDEVETFRSTAGAILDLVEIITPNPRSDRPLQLPQHIFEALFQGSSLSPALTFTFRRVTFTPHPTQARTWLLSRQPMRTPERESNQWNFAPRSDEDERGEGTDWRLWDNRFWIRISTHNVLLNEIEVAPFALYADSLPPQAKEELEPFRKLVARTAPGKTKLALPVLLYRGHIIGLPSLGIVFSNTMHNLGISVNWEVCYKAIKQIEHLRMIE